MIIILLLLGLAIEVYFSQQTHIFQNRAAAPPTNPSRVTISNGRLLVNNITYFIHGVSYVPEPIGQYGVDPAAAVYDVPRIAALGANTIRMSTWTTDFYPAVYPEAEKNNLKIILGFSPPRDWGNQADITSITLNIQQTILNAKSHPSTLIYNLGNEEFENLKSADQVSYAKWIESMVKWIHTNDPDHPVMYIDTAYAQAGLPILKQYVQDLDIYATNNYHFRTTDQLISFFDQNMKGQWPGKIYLISEYGCDSYDNKNQVENQPVQANWIVQLSQAVRNAHNSRPSLIGGIVFEYADGWATAGSPDPSHHDNTVGIPNCSSCFDGVGNKEYWGLTEAVYPGQADKRVLKPAYFALQNFWNGSSMSPTPSPTSVPIPPTPTNPPPPTATNIPLPTSTTSPTPVPTSTPTPTPTPSITISSTPTPTISQNCVCKSDDSCDTSCTFDTYPDVTYNSPIKCLRETSIVGPTPNPVTKTSYCQRPERTKGDVDGDGVVNNLDYFYYVSAVNGGGVPVNVDPDVNGDGKVTPSDRAIIIKTLGL